MPTKMTTKIKLLPQEVISRVAAGEVIDHPASVVKELIENAIDALATQINIEVDGAGLEKIRVSDNGIGMTPEDLEQCFIRHTTSKIYDLDDLEAIKSLGFRGEALYSISSISDTNIRTKTKDAIAGFELDIKGGEASPIRPVGIPEGTSITVNNLFFNLPARKKFFDNKNIETKKIVQTVTQAALAYPNIGFSLKLNNKVSIHTPKDQNTEDRIEYLLGEGMTKDLLPLKHDSEHIKISGYISKPQSALNSRELQYIFVNNRPINNKNISNTIKRSFGTLIDVKTHPIIIVNIQMPHSMLDVNIHPRKLEVMFVEPRELTNIISQIVRSTLGISDLNFEINTTDNDLEDFETFLASGNQNPVTSVDYEEIQNNKKGNPYLAQLLKDETNLWNIKTNEETKKNEDIAQIKNLYLVIESQKGLSIIDQHAAHERILYEEFLESFESKKSKREIIEKNEVVQIPVTLVELAEKNIETLKRVGIDIEHFGDNAFKINSVIDIYKKHNLRNLLIEVLSDLEENGITENADNLSLKTISYLACRTAIKAGDYLTKKERKNLIEKLENTKTNYTCPHGRPVKIDIGMRELGKMFKRLG